MFDLYLYNQPLLTIVKANVSFQRGTSQWMIYSVLLVGFCYSIGVDYRVRKNKKTSKSS
ncbi:hypothetical protein [Robertmurraya korlensis]|uniref:hypothetical protein n=1 Tax=Robertmurraya korlensis TaxID=519977 RepID=UPI0012ED83CC|nr:hypothetical protein [Robertmurraya korlensis]